MGVVILTAALTLAGGLGWTLQEQAGRRQTTRQGITQSLSEATTFLSAGQLAEASAAIRKAEGFLAGGGEAEQDLARAINQARRDLDTVSLFQEAHLRRATFYGGIHDGFDAALAFAAAFRQYGLDLAALAPEEAAARIRESAIREHLLAALDEWTFKATSPSGRERLLAVARLADDDPWRSKPTASFSAPVAKSVSPRRVMVAGGCFRTSGRSARRNSSFRSLRPPRSRKLLR